MKPCSYFLPKSYLNELQVDNENESLVKCCVPVFSHKFDNVHRLSLYSDHQYSITTADSGRGILVEMTKVNEVSTLVFLTEYQFSDDSIMLSKKRVLYVEHNYDHRVYDSDKGVCFFFNYLQSLEEKCTRIYIRYAMVGDNDGHGTVKEAFVLEYNQLFNEYTCGCSVKENMLVVITSNQPGVKEQVSYMDLLSYEVFTNGRVKIKHNFRQNVTEVMQLNECINVNEIISPRANYIYSTFDGKKLILVCPNKYSVVVYSISDDTFGPLCNFQQSNIMTVHCFDDYFYVYHKDFGDLLIICNQEGKIRVARENNLKMKALDEKAVSLSDFGFSDETFDFLHVDCFDDILIFVLASDCNELLVISFFQKSVLCRYVPDVWNEPYADIMEVTTNWSGEEVFVFLCRADGKFALDILYLKKKKELCLKELSKMAVLQTYSVKDLMEMNLPKRLREEMKLLNLQNEYFDGQ